MDSPSSRFVFKRARNFKQHRPDKAQKSFQTKRNLRNSATGEKSHEKLRSKVIQRVFKKTGCCLDIKGKENDRVDIDQVQTFEVPKLGDEKMKKLTESEITEWEKRESDLRTSAVMESLE